jgi:hypothetical protein
MLYNHTPPPAPPPPHRHPAGDALYLSGTEFNLEPLVSEYYGDRAGTNYYSVAVVPAAFCTPTPAPTLASLRVSETLSLSTGFTGPILRVQGLRLVYVLPYVVQGLRLV